MGIHCYGLKGVYLVKYNCHKLLFMWNLANQKVMVFMSVLFKVLIRFNCAQLGSIQLSCLLNYEGGL